MSNTRNRRLLNLEFWFFRGWTTRVVLTKGFNRLAGMGREQRQHPGGSRGTPVWAWGLWAVESEALLTRWAHLWAQGRCNRETFLARFKADLWATGSLWDAEALPAGLKDNPWGVWRFREMETVSIGRKTKLWAAGGMCAAGIQDSKVGASPLEEGQKQKVTERSLELSQKAKVS